MDYITLNKLNLTPLYKQLKDSIKSAINSGILKPNDKLPTEDELCERFEISRTVVRQAYSELMAEGLITRHKGKGTFVREQELHGSFFKDIISFDKEMRNLGIEPKTKVLDFRIIPYDQEIFSKLKLGKDEECIFLKRLRFGNNIPLVVVDAYLSANKFPGLIEEDLEKHSLYELLEKKYKIYPIKVKRSFEARIVSNHDADLLQIKRKSAVQFVESIDYDQYNEIIQYSRSVYASNRYKFEVIIDKSHSF